MSKLQDLINKLCPNGVEFVKFSDVADYIRGITYRKSDEVKADGIPILRANNITLEYNALNFNEVKYIKTSAKIKDSQYLYHDDILICAGSGSKDHVGKVAFINEDMRYAFGGFMAVIRVKNSSILLPRFLFHNLTSQNFRKYIRSEIEVSTINNLNNGIVNNFKIPVPPLPVQEKIVKILDKFESLCNDLVKGLPAEIEARRKQYEFYRDKLLNFEEIRN